eukprot:Rmarinus@m.16851
MRVVVWFLAFVATCAVAQDDSNVSVLYISPNNTVGTENPLHPTHLVSEDALKDMLEFYSDEGLLPKPDSLLRAALSMEALVGLDSQLSPAVGNVYESSWMLMSKYYDIELEPISTTYVPRASYILLQPGTYNGFPYTNIFCNQPPAVEEYDRCHTPRGCLFQNLYYIRGRFIILADGDNLKWDAGSHAWVARDPRGGYSLFPVPLVQLQTAGSNALWTPEIRLGHELQTTSAFFRTISRPHMLLSRPTDMPHQFEESKHSTGIETITAAHWLARDLRLQSKQTQMVLLDPPGEAPSDVWLENSSELPLRFAGDLCGTETHPSHMPSTYGKEQSCVFSNVMAGFGCRGVGGPTPSEALPVDHSPRVAVFNDVRDKALTTFELNRGSSWCKLNITVVGPDEGELVSYLRQTYHVTVVHLSPAALADMPPRDVLLRTHSSAVLISMNGFGLHLLPFMKPNTGVLFVCAGVAGRDTFDRILSVANALAGARNVFFIGQSVPEQAGTCTVDNPSIGHVAKYAGELALNSLTPSDIHGCKNRVNHLTLLQYLKNRFNYQSYLEIGCGSDATFLAMNMDKVGVDPLKGGTHRMTSDEFFETNTRTFDLIYVDGLHWSVQVVRDVMNAINCLNPNGTIVIHDSSPDLEEEAVYPYPYAHVTRDTDAYVPWNGDVWRAVVFLRTLPDIDVIVGDFDYGLAVLRVRTNTAPLQSLPTHSPPINVEWADFDRNRREWLRLSTFDEIIVWLDQELEEPSTKQFIYAALAQVTEDLLDLSLPNDAASASEQALALLKNTQEESSWSLYNNWGIAQYRSSFGSKEHALVTMRKAATLNPDHSTIAFNLANMLYATGDVDGAADVMRETARRDPDNLLLGLKAAMILPSIYSGPEEISFYRTRLQEAIDAILRHPSPRTYPPMDCQRSLGLPAYGLIFHNVQNRAILEGMTKAILRICPGLGVGSSGVRPEMVADRSWRYELAGEDRIQYGLADRVLPDRKIRVGFHSAFFHAHSSGLILAGIMTGLPKNIFTVVALFMRHTMEDELTTYIQANVDEVYYVPQDMAEAQQLIALTQLDILVYSDIWLYSFTSLLAMGRFAPIQMTTVGVGMTSGIDTIDFYVSSRWFNTPEDQQHFSEALVLLNSTAAHFTPFEPLQPSTENTRSRYGIPPGTTVYNCFQTANKIHPDFDFVIRDVLARDPDGVVVLQDAMSTSLREKMHRRLERNLGSYFSRVIFVERMSHGDYLDLLRLSDVALDPFPFGGFLTTASLFSVGLPTVTLPGNMTQGRFTYALYAQVGVFDCVARDQADYVEKAYAIAHNRQLRDEIGQKLKERAPGLVYSNPVTVKEWGDMLLQTYLTFQKSYRARIGAGTIG